MRENGTRNVFSVRKKGRRKRERESIFFIRAQPEPGGTDGAARGEAGKDLSDERASIFHAT